MASSVVTAVESLEIVPSPITVLIMDGSLSCRLASEYLAAEDFHLLHASAVTPAFEAVERYPGEIGFIVADAGAPSAAGIRLAEVLARQDIYLPFLFVGSDAAMADLTAIESLRDTNWRLLDAPFGRDHLFAVVNELLAPGVPRHRHIRTLRIEP